MFQLIQYISANGLAPLFGTTVFTIAGIFVMEATKNSGAVPT